MVGVGPNYVLRRRRGFPAVGGVLGVAACG